MAKRNIFSILFREKPAMMLVTLKNSKKELYASSLAKIIDCTYSHVVKILQEMEKSGIITFEKQGRVERNGYRPPRSRSRRDAAVTEGPPEPRPQGGVRPARVCH